MPTNFSAPAPQYGQNFGTAMRSMLGVFRFGIFQHAPPVGLIAFLAIAVITKRH